MDLYEALLATKQGENAGGYSGFHEGKRDGTGWVYNVFREEMDTKERQCLHSLINVAHLVI